MTIVDDVHDLQVEMRELRGENARLEKAAEKANEQLNGERGISRTLDSLTAEIQGLRKAAYWLAGLIVSSSLGFAFTVLLVIPQ